MKHHQLATNGMIAKANKLLYISTQVSMERHSSKQIHKKYFTVKN